MSSVAAPPRWNLAVTQRNALIAGVVAAALCVLGFVVNPGQFFRSYLAAYQWVLGIGAGCLVWVMLYHLTGGAWGYVLRHILEAGMRTLPLLAVLFVPVALGMEYLYPWTDKALVAADKHLRHKEVYLNIPFFLIRAAIYLGTWIVLSYLLNRWSREQDETADPTVPRKFRMFSAPGLAVYGLTITFAGIDWLMSLQPDWYSTIFSVIIAVGQILSAMAFAIVVLVLLLDRPPLDRVVSPDVLNDIANLLLTFVVLWTYMTFAQFMLIWVGNLPEEIVWYLPRSRDGWQWVAGALALFHFLVPFFLLLSRDVKRNPRALGLIAAGILFMQLVQLYWQVLPAFRDTYFLNQWQDIVAPVAIGGLWLAYFLWQLQRRPLLPRHDPNLHEAEHLRAVDREQAQREEATTHG